MTRPQAGIFALGTRTHHHLEFDLRPGASAGEVRACLADLGQPHVTAGATNLVIGFGPDLWRDLAPGEVPADLGPFVEVSNGYTAPATQHDMWVWVHGSGIDEVLDTVRVVAAVLEGPLELADDSPCFVYHDSRDLSGFVDGSANPSPPDAPEVAVIAEGSPGAGGSHVITMSWVHDLARFNELEVPEQEKVIGRTKLDSVAIADRPADSHISMAEIHDEAGEERPIYRRSTPWGDASEQGLYFIGFSAERDRFDAMLAAMYGTDGSGLQDRLLAFSTPVSGSYYFAPGLDDLRALGIG